MYHIPRATESLGNKPESTPHSALSMTTTIASHRSSEIPTTLKMVILSVLLCFGVAILIILLFFLYTRRQRRNRHKYSVKDPGIAFNRDVFAKKPASPLDKYVMADLGKVNGALSPLRRQYLRELSPTTPTFDDNTMRRQPSSKSPFKVVNVDEDEKMAIPTLAFPEPLAEKKGRTPRPKPTWLRPITIGEEVRSPPPPTYGASSLEEETLFPIPPHKPPQMVKATLVPTTPRSRASLKSLASSQSLIIPDFEPMPVISPARSASFARKDLDLPSPSPPHTPPANLTSGSAGGQIDSSLVEQDEDAAPSRLMTVVARYTPNLPDELHVKLGDVVRVIAEYKDGWCFAQHLGTMDAPKGVLPLVCLQAAFTVTHKASNKSLTTINWR